MRKHDARLSERVNRVRECSLRTVHGAALVQGQMEGSSGAAGAFPAGVNVPMSHRPLSSGQLQHT